MHRIKQRKREKFDENITSVHMKFRYECSLNEIGHIDIGRLTVCVWECRLHHVTSSMNVLNQLSMHLHTVGKLFSRLSPPPAISHLGIINGMHEFTQKEHTLKPFERNGDEIEYGKQRNQMSQIWAKTVVAYRAATNGIDN